MTFVMTKPIQIKKEDVTRDIRELAALTGLPITEAVGEVVRERLEHERRKAAAPDRKAAIHDAIARYQAAVKPGRMPTDDDFYDENGLPR
jgi:hypothetical protein